MSGDPRLTVLHYVGYNDARGGIVAVVRALAAAGRFECVLGVNPGFHARRQPALATFELPAVAGESIGLRTFWQTRAVARRAREWLRAEPDRVFHGRSRTGLLAALWLDRLGEKRVVASVHCLGRQRWFYRHAAARLGDRLVWLGPAMKKYYGVGDATWAGCVPDCVATPPVKRAPRRGGELRVGCVGALVPVKQWELVLRALAAVPRVQPIRMLHAGGEDGTAASAACAQILRRLAAELGVEARVEWRGEVADMAAFYAEIDCLVVASRWEASSMAALEAAAAGVPIVASDAAGTRDLVETAGAGWLFRADDAGDLARSLGVCAAPGGVGALTMAPERLRPFTAAAVAEQWAKIYARLGRSDAE